MLYSAGCTLYAVFCILRTVLCLLHFSNLKLHEILGAERYCTVSVRTTNAKSQSRAWTQQHLLGYAAQGAENATFIISSCSCWQPRHSITADHRHNSSCIAQYHCPTGDTSEASAAWQLVHDNLYTWAPFVHVHKSIGHGCLHQSRSWLMWYLGEVSTVGEVEGQQWLGLNEHMRQLGAAIQVQMRQLGASCCWWYDRLADVHRSPQPLQ